MLADKDETARSIAKGIGYNKAKDISNRLTSLHNRHIIDKIKQNNGILWSIQQTPLQEPTSNLQETVRNLHETEIRTEKRPAMDDTPEEIPTASNQRCIPQNCEYELQETVKQLTAEIIKLISRVQSLEINMSSRVEPLCITTLDTQNAFPDTTPVATQYTPVTPVTPVRAMGAIPIETKSAVSVNPSSGDQSWSPDIPNTTADVLPVICKNRYQPLAHLPSDIFYASQKSNSVTAPKLLPQK